MTDKKTSDESENVDSQTEKNKAIGLDYPAPVNKLLTLADARKLNQMPDFYGMGLRKKHAPDLIRMAIDAELYESDRESLMAWAPIHAWRALAILNITDAISPLIEGLFWRADNEDEWVIDDMPVAFSHFGPVAIPALTKYLDPSIPHGEGSRILAMVCLGQIAVAYENMHLVVADIFYNLLNEHHHSYPTALAVKMMVHLLLLEPEKSEDELNNLMERLTQSTADFPLLFAQSLSDFGVFDEVPDVNDPDFNLDDYLEDDPNDNVDERFYHPDGFEYVPKLANKNSKKKKKKRKQSRQIKAGKP